MKRFVRLLPLLVVPLFGACEFSEVIGPQADELESYVQQMDMQSFQSIVVQGAAQVEVSLLPGGLTASEIAVRPSGQSNEERIQSLAVDFWSNGVEGSVTLALGGLVVTFDENTRFYFGEDEIDVLTFVAQLAGNLLEGFDLPVVAERALPAVAQDPDDPTFLAAAIAIDSDGSPQLRLEVDADNLEMAANPAPGEPDGWLNVLGLRIQLRVTDGTTELEQEDHDFEVIEDFESFVSTAETDEMLVVLEDGTTVRVDDRTDIVEGPTLIGSVAEVAEALASGLDVIAWGRGAVETAEPLVMVGLQVSFEAREPEEPEVVEFEGVVESVDEASFVLEDGTVVLVGDDLAITAYNEMSPSSLAELAGALAEGVEVIAWGEGIEVGDFVVAIEATELTLKAVEVEQPEHFEGEVVEADATTAEIFLGDGVTVVVGDDTEVVAYNDASPMSVADVVAALEGGLTVLAWGHGMIESEDPVVIAADRIVLKSYQPEPENQVQAYVTQIDVEGMTLVLEDGTSVIVTENTEIVAYHDFSPTSLAEALEDLNRWRFVWAKATGEFEGDGEHVLVADRLVLKTVVEDFDKKVESIDVESGDVILEGGWILHVWDDAEVRAADGASPMTLAAAAEALAAGDEIRFSGFGYVICFDPFSIEVVDLTILRVPQG